MNIVITGGSGFIGTKLSKALLAKGDTVIVVDIAPPTFTHEKLFFIQCDLTRTALPYNVLDRTDAVVHLAGAPIIAKWTEKYKKQINDSRIESTRRVVESIKSAESRPTVFVCASAIGFYGDTHEKLADEQAEKGEGFLSDVVAYWEAEAREALSIGTRVVCVRTAPVIGPGKRIAMFMKTAKFGFLLKIARKDFWMSWIHEDDIVNVYLFALETNTLQGVVNAAAPEPVLQSTFFKTLGKIIHRKVFGTVPRWIMRRLYGELYDELSKSQQIYPKRLMDKGFVFAYPTLESALTAATKTSVKIKKEKKDETTR